jgi:hypothetical protein
MISSGSA